MATTTRTKSSGQTQFQPFINLHPFRPQSVLLTGMNMKIYLQLCLFCYFSRKKILILCDGRNKTRPKKLLLLKYSANSHFFRANASIWMNTIFIFGKKALSFRTPNYGYPSCKAVVSLCLNGKIICFGR